jgi:hypothetical protein
VHKSSDQQAIQQTEVTADQRTLNVVLLLIVDLGGTTLAAAMVAAGPCSNEIWRSVTADFPPRTQQIVADAKCRFHTHTVSIVVAPKVKIVVANAAMVAQRAAMRMNAPVWPKSWLGSALPSRCHIQPITAR